MLRQLLLSEQCVPFLKEYKDGKVPAKHVRVRSSFGAPKHGTELTVYKDDPFAQEYYDEETNIFRRKEKREAAAGKMGLGNMWVGNIIEIGEGVSGFTIGERVAGYGNLKNTHTVKADELLKMPETMAWQAAVCFDPLQFALGGIRDGHVRIGDRVLISGLGAIGLMAAQVAKLSGASLVAVSDPIEIRRKVALENGADIAYNPITDDIGLLLRDKTRGKGVDVVIETSGNYKAIEQGLRALAYGGTLAVVGWLKECKYPIHLGKEAHFNQQKIVFSRACSDPNNDHPRWSFERICFEAWEMLCKGMFKCENIVSPVVPFDECDKGYLRYVVEHPEESVKMGVVF